MTVKGGVGKIIEYGGEGVATLSVPERATITNMGAELGATTSIFPSDEITYKFLKAQGREDVYTPLCADEDAVYNLTKAIFDNVDAIAKENGKGAEVSIENATDGMTAPFHAGAAKYFAEKGVTVVTE